MAFGWAILFVGHFVEAFSSVVALVSYQKSVFMPCGYGLVVYVEFLGNFALGEQAGFAQSVVVTG